MVLTVEQAAQELRDRARTLRERTWVAGLPQAPGESCALIDCERLDNGYRILVSGLTPDAAGVLSRHLGMAAVVWNDEQPDVEHVAAAMEAAADAAAERLGVLV